MAALGLIKQKEIWFPTGRGLGLVVVALILVGMLGMAAAVPFLATTQPRGRGVLVVEGWLPDYALEEAKKTFESHSYRTLVVTGVPLDTGFFICRERDFAQLGLKALVKLGVSRDSLVPLSSSEAPRDRTVATAQMVRAWLDSGASFNDVDVFTLGVHARRTWRVYQMVLGKKYQVGIIAGQEHRYNPRRWWTASSGVRTVMSEWIAYIYTQLFLNQANLSEMERDPGVPAQSPHPAGQLMPSAPAKGPN